MQKRSLKLRLRHLRRRLQRLTYRLHNAWYWLKCRLWYRYNVVVCRALPPTWCDRDYLLLYAAFQLLEDFIEKEEPWEFAGDVYATYVTDCDENFSRQRAAEWQTIRNLYAWWKGRKNDDDHDDYEEDSKRLHTLIDVRANLWT